MPDNSPTPQLSGDSLPGTEIINFTPGEPSWFIVNDTVMGGVSRSEALILPADILLFTGSMSLDNNGGFASVRSDWAPLDLGDADGVLLRVLGDGKDYRFRVRTTEAGQDVTYNALFPTEPGTWTVVYVPFANMVPTYRGFTVDVPAIDPATIRSFGFMLSDKQEGDFELQVDWIRAVTEAALAEFEN